MVLVTGALGMLGKVLCASLKKKRSVAGVSRRAVEGLERCDLSEPSQVRELFGRLRPEAVIHTAAYSDVDGCEQDPGTAYASNALAVKNLAEACAARSTPWVHVSTDYVFDGRAHEPYREDAPAGPVNIYGMTKWIGEFYARASEAPCAVVRTSWLFGPENPRTFVNAVAARLKKEGTVSVLDNQTTAPTSVKDLAAALERLLDLLSEKGSAKRPDRVFHVCNRGGATHLEIARAVREILGLTQARVERTDTIPNRPAMRPRYSVMDTALFERTSGLKMRPWRESLADHLKEGGCAS